MSDSPLSNSDYVRLTGFEGDWRDSWWNLDFLQLLSQRHGFEGLERVLDLGCGAGHWGRILSQVLPSALSLQGIDPNETFIEMARQAAPNSNFTYKRGTAEAIPADDESFDLVTCQTVLIHVPDASKALKEMQRVLKPGGLLLAAEPNNVASSFTILGGSPELPWRLQEAWIRFQYICEVGKRRLGDGDSSVGERLGGLVASAGFQDVQVCINEKTPALFPPYDSPGQKVEVAQMLEWLAPDTWLGFGTRENSHRYFSAGCPQDADADFETHWDLAMKTQELIRSAILAETFQGGRCPNFYVTTGRRAP